MGRTSRISSRCCYAVCCALAVWLPAARPAQAQRVEARLSTDSVTVGDRFTLTLVAVHPFMFEPAFPDPAQGDSLFGDLEVISRARPGGRNLGAANPGLRLDSVVYEVTTFALDTAYVPPLRVRFTANEDTLSAASAALWLRVASLVPPEAEDLRGLAPLVEFPRPLWPYVLLALALLVLVGLLLYYLRAKRRAPPPPPQAPPPPPGSPYDEAIRRLRALEAAAYEAPEQAKPFFVELSDVLRTYLEARLGVPALERTTRELRQELEGRYVRYKLPGAAPGRVQNLLERADLVKFADLRPPAAQSREALEETRKTIDSIETKLRQIAVTAPESPVVEAVAP